MTKCLLMIPTIFDAHLSKSPPLGIAYIAANLEKNDIKVKIIDAPTLNLTHKQVSTQVKLFKPDFLGISVTMQSYKSACRHLREFKKFLPKCKFVFGGPIVTFQSEKIMMDCPDLDFCVRGEGEETMTELINTVTLKTPLRRVLGLTWKKLDKITKNPDRPLITNLDSLPFPAWHLLPMEKYRGTADLGGGQPFTTVIATRGCIFHCRFCAATIMWRGQRRRSINNVLNEIETLVKKYQIKYLHFPDDLLLANKKYALEFCQGMIERGLNKISWSCNGRVNLMDHGLLENLKKAGCVCVFYGIESGNQKILNAIDKGVTLAQITKAVKMTHQTGLRVSGSLLVGYPGETKKTIRQTVAFAIKLDLDYASFHIVVPYPGTPLYDDCRKNGWLLSDKWEDYVLDIYGEPNQTVIKLKHLTSEELTKLYCWANQKFTHRPAYIWKIFRFHPALFLEMGAKTGLSRVKSYFGRISTLSYLVSQ